MGKGVDAARDDAPVHADVLDDFKDQLLLALVRKAGGTVALPVAQVDDNAGWLLAMSVNDGVFHFEARKKQ